ncbi:MULTISPECIES: membrane-targeted effector domain-containing toxin [unclassified Pseudomonas]|jgi:hypothetical protein|uniref:membrane-targeted effector domain-containing toxin n=1 Tax=unclassified Pseudomonas TaxID=196821 RepID=UPI00069DC4D6|nr:MULTISPECIES: membrane-targeted effector domain-containing toxin [unclassified Pseudomonas]WPN48156.1 membrane-targeted effector domain-containing toxin [Pseudomonas sp. P8_241]
MKTSDTETASVLPSAEDELLLKDLVSPFVEACPDMHEMARNEAQKILDKYGIKNIDPDHVWWHRFENTSASSAQAFLGWEHYPKPIESLTLPQLVIQRFRLHDQDNADLLDGDGGFYSQDASATIYNETNEVRMYPSQVIKDLWRINFSELYLEKMERFWSRHSDDYRTLAKLNFIAKALEEHDSSRLSNENLKTVLMAVARTLSWPVTLDMLKTENSPIEKLRVAPLHIGGYMSTDILRVVDQNGCQILYTPGELDAFHVFESPYDLHWWLLCQTNHADNRARFMSHFPLWAQKPKGDEVGLNNMIDLLFVTWGKYDHSLFDTEHGVLDSDPFTWLRDQVKERMADDAALSLRSNGDLREQMWIGYLTTFSRLFGPMAVIGWPAALAAVGAGLASIGLNIDQAINGIDAKDRKSGVIGIIVSTIDTLFNLLALKGAVELTEVGSAKEVFTPQENLATKVEQPVGTVPKIAELAPGRTYVQEGENLLAPFETNEILDGLEPISNEGMYRNIYQPPSGGNYIEIDDAYYLVRYVKEMKTWAIIDPANPYSFYRSVPVRLNAEGEWEALTRLGLKGGGKIFGARPWGRAPAPLPETPSVSTAYDVPVELREELKSLGSNKIGGRPLDDQFVNLANPENAMGQFKELRRTLYRDAHAFYANPPLAARPTVPTFGSVNKTKDIIKTLFKKTPNLVIGEQHASVGSKQLLIENMEVLAKQEVKTLYMEHLLTDFHQADLDIFNKGGAMSEDLESYLKQLDQGHGTDPTGQYNFLEVVKAAQKNHIRIQAIDCAASYQSKGITGASSTYRQEMMNYFAKTVIDADQVAKGPHRWVALVGESHANTWNGVAGVSELEGGIGVRVESAEAGQATRIEVDPGRVATDPETFQASSVKNDLRLQIQLPPALLREQALNAALTKPGMITVEKAGSRFELIHRSRAGALERTPINYDSTGYWVKRPTWDINHQHFSTFQELVNALDRMGMTRVRVP